MQEDIPDEWKILSSLYSGLPMHIDEIDMLGRCGIYLNHDWGEAHVNPQE